MNDSESLYINLEGRGVGGVTSKECCHTPRDTQWKKWEWHIQFSRIEPVHADGPTLVLFIWYRSPSIKHIQENKDGRRVDERKEGDEEKNQVENNVSKQQQQQWLNCDFMLVTRALICGLREMSRRVCKHLSKHARDRGSLLPRT